MAFDDAERTEAPTPKRRQEARERGQVARSAELTSALLLLGACGALTLGGTVMAQTLLVAFRDGLELGGTADLTVEAVRGRFIVVAWTVAKAIGPVVLTGGVMGVLANVLQVGFLVTPQAIGMQWDRVNPMRGLSTLLSMRGVVETVKALLKLAILGGLDHLFVVGVAGEEEEVVRDGHGEE